MGRKYFRGALNPNFKHGLISSEKKSLYVSWLNMKGRCLRKTHPKYNRYGGRGIKICEEWIKIEGFYEWALKSGWSSGLTLDRVDNDGGYAPDNCRWVSLSENSRKKRTTKISFEQAKEIRKRAAAGECEYKLAKEYGVVHGTIWFVVNNFTHVPEMERTKRIALREKRKVV